MKRVFVKNRALYLALSLLLTNSHVLCQNIDPQSIISVEFKMGAADQGIDLYPDMLCGVPASIVMTELEAMDINTLRIPVSGPVDSLAVTVLISFVRELYNNGGENLSILLSQRKWDLYKISQQESWAEDISTAFNALDTAGYGTMVKGCIFDENRALNGAQSTKALWDERHNGILGALDLLNSKSNNAFKNRTVFIHGKGYGSQFLGVKESSDGLDFPNEMSTRCSNYAYNFKYFQVGDPSDKSLAGWIEHYINYCKLSEVFELGVPILFVGDAGDGLRPNSFIPNKNPYGGPGQYVVKGLRDVFKIYKWSGFSIGPFLREGTEDEMGQTILFSAYEGMLTERIPQTDSWWTWYETTRLPAETSIINTKRLSNSFSIYPNPANQNQIHINSIKEETLSSVDISIYNINGQILHHSSRIFTNNESIDISTYKAGVYFIQILANDRLETIKLIIE